MSANLPLRLLQLSSIKDSRDRVYRGPKAEAIQSKVDLRNYGSIIEDQGKLGSCTGLASTTAYEIMMRIHYPEQAVELSDLFVYFNSRLFYPSVGLDTGAYLRDSLQAIKRFGVCRESLWPYNISKFARQPTADCYADALTRTITEYELLLSDDDIVTILNSKRPVVISMELYPEFDMLTADNDVVPMPKESDKITAYHAMVLVGYDVAKQQYLAQNSYGTDWGNKGYCWIPFEYLRKHGLERWFFSISDPTIPTLN